MPYHTRTRSHTDPAPASHAPLPSSPIPRLFSSFPPPGLTLHPDDQNSKVLHAIANALLAVNNRAMTIKDLAHAALRHGLACSGAFPLNAACQQITSYIRLHHRRCEDGLTKPLLRSYTLTGTSEDDALTPALHSRAGGTATRRGGAVDTAFRKGTLVWYLTTETGAQDPFHQAGITLPTSPKKRRRRTNTCGIESTDSEEDKRPKIKLKIKLGSLSSLRSISATTTQPPLTSGSSDSVPIIVDSPSPPASPLPSCSLSLPPYPIKSHTRYLHDIPNSPFDLPEYASPPPDSEDDYDDFHTSMMVPDYEDSDSPPIKEEEDFIKEEYDSDVDDTDGCRSRSTSWTTITDPKTPHEIDQPTTLKIEACEDSLAMLRWDSPFASPGLCKLEDQDVSTSWMSQVELSHLMSTHDGSFINPPLANKIEELDDEPSHNHMARNRSFSAPASTWHIRTPLFINPSLEQSVNCTIDEDGLEILGPDTVPPEEFDDCFRPCENSETAETVNQSPSLQQTASPQSHEIDPAAYRWTAINGIQLYELDINGHVLRRRVDNGTIHLTSLLRLLSNKPPSTDFFSLDGASHIKDGLLKGAWVPMAFARSLVKDRNVSSELLEFLTDRCGEPSSPTNDATSKFTALSLAGMAESFHKERSQPGFELQSTADEEQVPTGASHTIKSLAGYCLSRPVWQRDGFTDWKVNYDYDSGFNFSALSIKPSGFAQPSDIPHSGDTPLSPQEEEIFHSLVDLGMSKSYERSSEMEECVLEADDEQEESTMTLRRSKRVAARGGPTKTQHHSTRRRSARTQTKK